MKKHSKKWNINKLYHKEDNLVMSSEFSKNREELKPKYSHCERCGEVLKEFEITQNYCIDCYEILA